ncbi:Uncharacterized protein OS=Desulfarculus baarsii (strain ATCC 33931 / DSM 2075 / VKM B-1802 / 2st14) GN=Deba_0018 PE=4 SV=1 [Gemmata massiliana]|uniref:Uncharacterized protein n=1 Tax=Gemmata massiliana TaxID=1210884 RepID=A0A6P2CYC6_9BACT|nr:hypothetical protein [Gemmata massiliana]VTR94118.1 Uncharacterized protein OS=Desulfarculus baarsii (strain ATCC 33931 / DSM 2075 / VKM B-1802 / 2st14) GN=Deba_0018 PE=4 SV=1 [Gemmata massiliana]
MSLRPVLALASALLAAGPAGAQVDPPDPAPDAPGGGISPALRSTLDALGASVGVPDGFGYSWSPRAPVRGQRASMGLSNYQFGLTLPVHSSDDDLVFADVSARVLDIRTDALLPTDRVRFPRALWDVQAGGGYVGQFDADWSWGATLNVGSASDRPFNTLGEMTLSALAFVRRADSDRNGNGWLFYVVSTSNGQLGRNIPVPGAAYEFHTDRLTAVVGFPFISVDYRPTRAWQFEFNYGALTDVLARASYYPADQVRLFSAFEWTNQAWFRAGRAGQHRQLFYYEKRIEAGFGWRVHQNVDFSLTPGFAFDRLFVESRGLGFRGRNRTDLAPARFLALQFELKY